MSFQSTESDIFTDGSQGLNDVDEHHLGADIASPGVSQQTDALQLIPASHIQQSRLPVTTCASHRTTTIVPTLTSTNVTTSANTISAPTLPIQATDALQVLPATTQRRKPATSPHHNAATQSNRADATLPVSKNPV